MKEYNKCFEGFKDAMKSLLTQREQEVIELRYGFYGDCLDVIAVGELVGCTGEVVRHIENKAIDKLRRYAHKVNHQIKDDNYLQKYKYLQQNELEEQEKQILEYQYNIPCFCGCKNQEEHDKKIEKYRRHLKMITKTHSAVNSAIKKGIIKKPHKCSMCGEEGNLVGHHEDYSKPIDVIWVCRRCHSKIHMKNDKHFYQKKPRKK